MVSVDLCFVAVVDLMNSVKSKVLKLSNVIYKSKLKIFVFYFGNLSVLVFSPTNWYCEFRCFII